MDFQPKRLIKIRENMGISKAEAARKLNMSAMGYGRYENGDRTPSYQTVCFISQTFNTTPDFLYGITDNNNPTQIIISFSDDPDLYELVCLCKENRNFANRILKYIKIGDAFHE
ncbi:MAG: helix-turn-helix transcriptional regulator [Lachnospiraceae bacterium]|nr:helix-turn-helix transcriptional regulator [Lachnospiraceae bacterium]